MALFSKTPLDNRTYVIDFTYTSMSGMVVGATSGAPLTATSGHVPYATSGLTVGNPSFNSNQVYWNMNGGVSNVTYFFSVLASISGSNTYEESITVSVL